jgi:hypothetical protein
MQRVVARVVPVAPSQFAVAAPAGEPLHCQDARPITHADRRRTLARCTLLAALALAIVSARFSITGLTSIFGGAFWPVIAMGCAHRLAVP